MLRPADHPRCTRAQPAISGAALLEALVALLVLSIGILGLLGAQVRSLAEMQTVVYRAQAVRLIDDLAERLRTHDQGTSRLRTDVYVGGWQSDTPGGADAGCDARPCSAVELAAWDVAQWRDRVARTLPLGRAAVFTLPDAAGTDGGAQLGVMVGWRANERARDDADYMRAFRIEASGVVCPDDLTCHLAYVQP